MPITACGLDLNPRRKQWVKRFLNSDFQFWAKPRGIVNVDGRASKSGEFNAHINDRPSCMYMQYCVRFMKNDKKTYSFFHRFLFERSMNSESGQTNDFKIGIYSFPA